MSLGRWLKSSFQKNRDESSLVAAGIFLCIGLIVLLSPIGRGLSIRLVACLLLISSLIIFLAIFWLSEKIWPSHDDVLWDESWHPSVPTNPMIYFPPVFTTHTTAKEFLVTSGPDSIRCVEIGFEESMEESFEFSRLQDEWLMTAPEETLRELLPCAETMLGKHPAWDIHFVHIVGMASELRGIPTSEEILEVANRLNHQELRNSVF